MSSVSALPGWRGWMTALFVMVSLLAVGGCAGAPGFRAAGSGTQARYDRVLKELGSQNIAVTKLDSGPLPCPRDPGGTDTFYRTVSVTAVADRDVNAADIVAGITPLIPSARTVADVDMVTAVVGYDSSGEYRLRVAEGPSGSLLIAFDATTRCVAA